MAKELPDVDKKFCGDFKEWTIKEAFQKFCGVDLDQFQDRDSLYEKIKNDFPGLPLPKNNEVTWDDLFFSYF